MPDTVPWENWFSFLAMLLGIISSLVHIFGVLFFYFQLTPAQRSDLLSRFGLSRPKSWFLYSVTFFLSFLLASHFLLQMPFAFTLAAFFTFILLIIIALAFLLRTRAQEIAHLRADYQRLTDAVEPLPNFITPIIALNERTWQSGYQNSTAVGDGERIHLVSALNHVETVFTNYTGEQCGVSIKQFLYDSPDRRKIPRYVFTLQRDSISDEKRRHIDNRPTLSRYEWERNTAFIKIVRNENDSRAFYISNDLAALGDEYENANPCWPEFYNATLVVPISFNDNPQPGDAFHGFLCIDNFRGDFDKTVCLNLAFLFSKMLFESLSFIDMIEKDRKQTQQSEV